MILTDGVYNDVTLTVISSFYFIQLNAVFYFIFTSTYTYNYQPRNSNIVASSV